MGKLGGRFRNLSVATGRPSLSYGEAVGIISSRLASRPLWVISRWDGRRVEVLTVEDATTLPAFCFEEEADLFLRGESLPRSDWRLRRITAAELASLLHELGAVEHVALDPLPSEFGLSIHPALMGREELLERLPAVPEPVRAGEPAPLARAFSRF
jgi:hypothetical protein